jgi:ABC-type dipeptide/oligopeptide/nickel transport system permease component
MIEVLVEDYITTARAKGLSERIVVYGHALRNSLIPVISIGGVRLGMLIGGSLVVETVFAYPGLGRLLIEGILMRDYAMVQGGVLVLVLIFTLVNLAADLAYGTVDPRIKYGTEIG